MSAILRINLENKSTITTPPSGYISLFAGADTTPISAATKDHLSVIDSTGALLRVPYLEENLTVATGYNFQQSVDISGSVWVGANHTVVADTILGTTCTDSLLVNATSTFNCPVTFNGGFTLSGNTVICGDLNMCGCDTGSTPTLQVSKISACTGTLSISNNVDICGNLNLCCATTAVTSTLTVSQISGCSGTLNILTPTIISGVTTIYGDTTIVGDLDLCNNLVTTSYVTGCTYDGLVSSTCISGGTPITGYTATTSAVTITSTTYNTLHVNTISACTGTLSISNNVDIRGNTYIADGALTLGDEDGVWTTIDSGNITTDRDLSYGADGVSGDTWAGSLKHPGVKASTTQTASTITGVIINSTSGRITLYDAGGSVLAPHQAKEFTVSNNKVESNYSLILLTVEQYNQVTDANLTASLTRVTPGQFTVRAYNSGTDSLDLTQQLRISFLVINP